MTWLLRGITISVILVALGVLLIFPDLTNNDKSTRTIYPDNHDTTKENSSNKETTQGKFLPIIRTKDISPKPIHHNSKPISKTYTKKEQTSTTADLQAPPSHLNNSDAQVITLIDDINPQFAKWITPPEQIRKWAAFIDHISQGKLSNKYRPLTFKASKFKVITQDGLLYPAPENHQRYNHLVDAMTYIPVDILARYYQYWLPIFNDAYAELGGNRNFNQGIRAAIDNILAVKPLTIEQTALKQPTSVTYQYIDPNLENQSDITKWMWRIGTENAKKLQKYLREFMHQLDH